jgi:hypothetical protein
VARAFLSRADVSYDNRPLPAGAPAEIHVGLQVIRAPDTAPLAGKARAALDSVGYPASADPHALNAPLVVAILALLVIYVTMVYGPIAALLVELFPTRIRYTSMSLPYHIGNGWFGGFLPTTAFAIVAATGNIYNGLWYPVVVAAATAVVGLVLLPETSRRAIDG